MHIRTAQLDDAGAISKLFCASIPRWQRIRPDGYAEDIAYDQLTIYERWLHGGAWMSIETASLWLSHLLRGAGQTYVLLDDADRPRAYAEAFLDTPDNDDKTLHLIHLVATDEEARHTLMRHLRQPDQPYQHLTSACSVYDEAESTFYQKHNMTAWRHVQRVNLPALTGQAFYKATPHADTRIAQIQGWRMPIGNGETSRYYWESLWHPHWLAIPQITAQRTHRLHLNASGQEAFLCLQQQLYEPRTADVYCWTPKPFSAQLLVAIRDWAHREGYRNLTFYVSDAVAKILGEEAEIQPQRQVIYRRTLPKP